MRPHALVFVSRTGNLMTTPTIVVSRPGGLNFCSRRACVCHAYPWDPRVDSVARPRGLSLQDAARQPAVSVESYFTHHDHGSARRTYTRSGTGAVIRGARITGARTPTLCDRRNFTIMSLRLTAGAAILEFDHTYPLAGPLTQGEFQTG